MMNKVIISGACGFIGKAVTRKLLEQGVTVYALCVNRENLNDLQLQYDKLNIVCVSFEKYPDLPEMIKERNFDVFFHFAWAGYGKATNDYKVQLENVVHTCEAAYAAVGLVCRKFVLADSSHEYLKNENKNGQLEYCSIYGAAKHSAQRMCRVISHTNGMIFNGVIFTNVFGPGDMSMRSTNTMIRKLLSDKSLDLIEGNRLYDWTYIDDCVNGIIAVSEKGQANNIYYVGSKYLRPFSDIIKEVRDIVKPTAELRFGQYFDNTYIDYSEINTFATYEDTGYFPESNFSVGIKKTVEWVKELDENI